MIPRPPNSTLLPYTTLFRSHDQNAPLTSRDGAVRSTDGDLHVLRRVDRGWIMSNVKRIQIEDLSGARGAGRSGLNRQVDRKSTRLNSSHVSISYAVFCLKKK